MDPQNNQEEDSSSSSSSSSGSMRPRSVTNDAGQQENVRQPEDFASPEGAGQLENASQLENAGQPEGTGQLENAGQLEDAGQPEDTSQPEGAGQSSAAAVQLLQAILSPSVPDTASPLAPISPYSPPDPQAQLASILTNSPTPFYPIYRSPTERVAFDSKVKRGSPPLPPLPSEHSPQTPGAQSPQTSRRSGGPGSRIGERYPPVRPRQDSGADWIIPLDEKPVREKTVGERLEPTLLTAIAEREKCAFNAKMTGYALNAAIGLQVLLGSLTTGLSAATTGRRTSIMTTILGGLATIVASYLARARGSNEPELSIHRVKDLEQFIRKCEAFKMDHGHMVGHEYDATLDQLRKRYEELLGNANSERRLAPPT